MCVGDRASDEPLSDPGEAHVDNASWKPSRRAVLTGAFTGAAAAVLSPYVPSNSYADVAWPDELEARAFGPIYRKLRVKNASLSASIRGWTASSATGVKVAFDPTGGHLGGGARVRVAAGTPPEWYGLAQRVAAPPPGSEIRLSGWLRTRVVRGGQGALLMVRFVSADGASLGVVQSEPSTGTSTWRHLHVDATVPAQSAYVWIKVALHGTGTMYADQLKLTHRSEPVPLDNPDFTSGAESWRLADAPSASVEVGDFGRNRSGARIIAAPEAADLWPGVGQTVPAPREGSVVRLTAWVRTEAVTPPAGAYLALSFVDDAGTRLGLVQSDMITHTQPWTLASVVGVVPRGCTAIEVSGLMHATGTAWFDEFRLDRLRWSRPAHARSVEVTLTDALAVSNLRGFGTQNNCYAFTSFGGMTTARTRALKARLAALKLSWLRIFADTAWWVRPDGSYSFRGEYIRALARTARIYQQAGARVNLVIWRSEHADRSEFAELAAHTAELVRWLRVDQGITAVRALTPWNEPDFSFPGSDREFRQFHSQLRTALDAVGQRSVLLVGADTASGGIESFERAVESLHDEVGSWSFHQYAAYDQPLNQQLDRVEARVELAATTLAPGPFIWETNAAGGAGGGTFSAGYVGEQLMPARHASSLTLVSYLLQALRMGASGAAYWELFDMDYSPSREPEWRMRFGMWSAAAEGFRLRPMYYLYQLLSSLIGPGSAVTDSVASADGVLIHLGVRGRSGRRVVYLLNPWGERVTAAVRWPTPIAELTQIVGSPASVAAAVAAQSVSLPTTRIKVRRGSCRVEVPAAGIVVLHS